MERAHKTNDELARGIRNAFVIMAIAVLLVVAVMTSIGGLR